MIRPIGLGIGPYYKPHRVGLRRLGYMLAIE